MSPLLGQRRDSSISPLCSVRGRRTLSNSRGWPQIAFVISSLIGFSQSAVPCGSCQSESTRESLFLGGDSVCGMKLL